MRRYLPLSLLLMLAVSVLAGCGPASPEGAIGDVNRTNLQRLANLYVRFQTQHRWQGPKDEAEFREYINGLDPMVLTRMGVAADEIEGLFVSERDNEPFKIRYGVRGNARGSNDAVIFESVGVKGERQVGFTSMSDQMVTDDARYEGLMTGKIKEADIVKGDGTPVKD